MDAIPRSSDKGQRAIVAVDRGAPGGAIPDLAVPRVRSSGKRYSDPGFAIALFHAESDGNWDSLVVLFKETGNGVLVAANAAGSMRGDAAAKALMRAIVPMIAEPDAPTTPPQRSGCDRQD